MWGRWEGPGLAWPGLTCADPVGLHPPEDRMPTGPALGRGPQVKGLWLLHMSQPGWPGAYSGRCRSCWAGCGWERSETAPSPALEAEIGRDHLAGSRVAEKSLPVQGCCLPAEHRAAVRG